MEIDSLPQLDLQQSLAKIETAKIGIIRNLFFRKTMCQTFERNVGYAILS